MLYARLFFFIILVVIFILKGMVMENFEVLKKLWADKHVLDIEIKDHIDELKAKDTYMKALDIPKTENDFRKNFEKELIDLYLLIAVKFADAEGQEKVQARLNNVLEKIKKRNAAWASVLDIVNFFSYFSFANLLLFT